MTGELVVVGEIFELRLARLACADQPQDAGDRDGLSGVVIDRDPAVMDPDRIVVIVADPVFALVGFGAAAGQMPSERFCAVGRVLGMNARGERIGVSDRRELRAEHRRIRQPFYGSGANIPGVGDIRGG